MEYVGNDCQKTPPLIFKGIVLPGRMDSIGVIGFCHHHQSLGEAPVWGLSIPDDPYQGIREEVL